MHIDAMRRIFAFSFYSIVPILTRLFYSCILRRSAVPFISRLGHRLSAARWLFDIHTYRRR
jgi:hypothetical protein